MASDLLLQHLGRSSRPADSPGRIVKIRSTVRQSDLAHAIDLGTDPLSRIKTDLAACAKNAGIASSTDPASGSPGAGSHDAGRRSTSHLQLSKRVKWGEDCSSGIVHVRTIRRQTGGKGLVFAQYSAESKFLRLFMQCAQGRHAHINSTKSMLGASLQPSLRALPRPWQKL